MSGWIASGVAVMGCLVLSGCGYTEQEMAAKQRQINALSVRVEALRVESLRAAHQASLPPPACPVAIEKVPTPAPHRVIAAR